MDSLEVKRITTWDGGLSSCYPCHGGRGGLIPPSSHSFGTSGTPSSFGGGCSGRTEGMGGGGQSPPWHG